MQPYLVPTIEFFDRASVPPEIQELLDEWPDIDPGTARLIRAAVMSRDPPAAAGCGSCWMRGRSWREQCFRAETGVTDELAIKKPPGGITRRAAAGLERFPIRLRNRRC